MLPKNPKIDMWTNELVSYCFFLKLKILLLFPHKCIFLISSVLFYDTFFLRKLTEFRLIYNY